MNKTVLFIFLSFITCDLFSQYGGQSFDSIPRDYDFVKLSFKILSDIRKGKLDKVETEYPINYKVDLKKTLIKECLKNGEIKDTSIIEHYWGNDNDTDISFNFECQNTLQLTIKSDDKDGNVKNVQIEINQGIKQLIIPLK